MTWRKKTAEKAPVVILLAMVRSLTLRPMESKSYANEMAWREDARRESNGLQWRQVAGAALGHPMSEQWRGYGRRSAAA